MTEGRGKREWEEEKDEWGWGGGKVNRAARLRRAEARPSLAKRHGQNDLMGDRDPKRRCTASPGPCFLPFVTKSGPLES